MQERRLAAIMFTDIVGYTALMGSDEDRAFEVLRKNRKIHSKLIEQLNGTIIKEMGDGMLVILVSPQVLYHRNTDSE
jgi:adenylate cyclase